MAGEGPSARAFMGADVRTMLDAAKLMLEPGSVAELRILNTNKKTVSGYFDDFDKLAAAAAEWDGKAPGVYVTLNAVNPDLLARSSNHLTEWARVTTSDTDIVRRRWLPIDCDPVRATGISSTEEEHDAAIARAKEIANWLKKQGWPLPILADSGNGAHLLYRIDLANDQDGAELIKRNLEALDLRFGDDAVNVDVTNYNAARIWKLYGTTAAKGDSTADRPHRVSKVLFNPPNSEMVDVAVLNQLADSLPKPDPKPRGGPDFDLEQFIADNLSVKRTGPWQGGTKWILETCPWNAEHVDGVAIFRFPSGAIAAKCHHGGCAGNDWAALRSLYEPDYEQRREQRRDGPQPQEPDSEAEDAPAEMLASAPTQGIGGGGKHFQPVRADILATSEPENTSWSWEGYAPQGGVTLFCAPPKTGKTTIAYHLASATSEGKPFLGQATTKSPVLVLAVEERRQDAANRVRALGLGENVYLHTGPLRADSIPTIAAFVVEKLIGLIIVDTLPRFWLLDNENDASAVNLAMAGIMALARDTNAALLLLYHLRKSPGGIDGEEIRGSGDIFSQVDIALIMRRRRDQSTQRTIKSFSRYDATPEEIVVALEDGEYVSLGDTEAVRDRETDTMLLEALSEVARTPEQIKEDADLKLAARTLFRHYERLFGTSRCAREGTGQKSLPYTYKMLAADEWQANPETSAADTNMLATTTDTLVVTDWQANDDHDNEGQRLYALSLWEGQASPASVRLSEGKTATDPEKLIDTGNADELTAFIAELEKS